jgi:hypothetical protein
MHPRTPRAFRTAVVALVATAATATTVLSAAPVSARVVEDVQPGSVRSALTCGIQVVAVDGAGKLVLRTLINGRVKTERLGSTALSYDPTALGFYDARSTSTTIVIKATAIASDGVPRLLTATYRKSGTTVSQSSREMQQTGFKPRLFADSSGYQAYTVNAAGVMNRLYITRDASGNLFFAHKLKVGSGYGGVRTLQFGTRLEVGGVEKDFLYATTATGALKQIAVPLTKPANVRGVTLKTTGYKGVTGLSTSYCNSDATFSTIVAVNATADTASWTTVRKAGHATPANTVKHGPAGAGADWVLHAVM